MTKGHTFIRVTVQSKYWCCNCEVISISHENNDLSHHGGETKNILAYKHEMLD